MVVLRFGFSSLRYSEMEAFMRSKQDLPLSWPVRSVIEIFDRSENGASSEAA